MNYKINILAVLFFTLFSCNELRETKELSKLEPSVGYHSDRHLIEAEELQLILGDEHVKVIDFRKSSEYEKGHIPNAINLWRTDIESEDYPYKGIIADQKEVEKALSKLGVQQDDIMIIYDDRGLCDASRLWWVLKRYNFKGVRLLNGGWSAWNSIEGLVTKEVPNVKPSKFEFESSTSKNLYIEHKELEDLLDEEDLVLIDTRTADEYSGKRQKSGAKRSGRIPKSENIDWMMAIDGNNTKKFKSREELEKIYASAGKSKDGPVITYCHTGVRSAHTTFVLTELLGYKNVKNYDGSWSEWSYFNRLPIEKDSVAKILN